MRLALTQILSVHWLLTFALISASALGADGGMAEVARTIVPVSAADPAIAALPYDRLMAGVIGVVFATLAAMFMWTLLMIWLGEENQAGEIQSVWRAAHACAIVAVSGMMTLLAGMGVGLALVTAAVLVAGLSASYAAMSCEWQSQGDAVERQDLAQATARMMALGAAHSSVLSNISGRGRSD